MKIIKTEEIRSLNASELSSKIIEVQKELFELRLNYATKKSVKTHLFKTYRHMLAQLLTEEHKLQNSKVK